MTVLSVPVLVDQFWLARIPSEFQDYFLNNLPGGCSTDMKLTVISNMGLLWKVLVKPEKLYGWKKFYRFLLDPWEDKTIMELPGIEKEYAKRLKISLGNYCSVMQLYNMFLCWGVDKFRRFLHWACQADTSNAGYSHIYRTVAAIEQKHRLSHNLPVYVYDPYPNQPEE